MSDSNQPNDVVERLIESVNNHDIEAVMSVIADDVEVFSFPSTLLESGASAIKHHLSEHFKIPKLGLRRMSSMIFGQTVVAMLVLTRAYPDATGQVAIGMIFEVCGDQIARAWVMPGMELDMQTGLPKFHRTRP